MALIHCPGPTIPSGVGLIRCRWSCLVREVRDCSRAYYFLPNLSPTSSSSSRSRNSEGSASETGFVQNSQALATSILSKRDFCRQSRSARLALVIRRASVEFVRGSGGESCAQLYLPPCSMQEKANAPRHRANSKRGIRLVKAGYRRKERRTRPRSDLKIKSQSSQPHGLFEERNRL